MSIFVVGRAAEAVVQAQQAAAGGHQEAALQ